jgi:predicted nuclease of predicted toxin-antitoxin system
LKVLLDSCVSASLKDPLEAGGHNVAVLAGEADPGDVAILARAFAEGRVLITLDKDFGELAVLHGHPHCGIIRLVNIAISQQALVCLQALSEHEESLSAGSIITASRDRMRKRPP